MESRQGYVRIVPAMGYFHGDFSSKRFSHRNTLESGPWTRLRMESGITEDMAGNRLAHNINGNDHGEVVTPVQITMRIGSKDPES